VVRFRRYQIKPTSLRCPSAWQRNPAEAPLIDAEKLFRQPGPIYEPGAGRSVWTNSPSVKARMWTAAIVKVEIGAITARSAHEGIRQPRLRAGPRQRAPGFACAFQGGVLRFDRRPQRRALHEAWRAWACPQNLQFSSDALRHAAILGLPLVALMPRWRQDYPKTGPTGQRPWRPRWARKRHPTSSIPSQ
jgi:hypothetical protein